MRVGLLWLVPLLLAVSACSVQVVPYVRGDSTQELETARADLFHGDEEAFTTEVYDAVLAFDETWLRAAFVAGITPEAMESGLADFYSNIPTQAVERADLVAYGRDITHDNGQRTRTVRSEYVLVGVEDSLTYLRIIARQTGDDGWELQNLWSFTVDPATFAIPGERGALRSFMHGMAWASPALILLALLVSWNVKRLKRRILWTLAIIVTAPTIAFNWSTQTLHVLTPSLAQNGEQLNLNLVNWVLTGSQVARAGDYHPWIITIGLPMGAIWFLLKWGAGGLEKHPRPVETETPGP